MGYTDETISVVPARKFRFRVLQGDSLSWNTAEEVPQNEGALEDIVRAILAEVAARSPDGLLGPFELFVNDVSAADDR